MSLTSTEAKIPFSHNSRGKNDTPLLPQSQKNILNHSASWNSNIVPPVSSEEEGKKMIQNVSGIFSLK